MERTKVAKMQLIYGSTAIKHWFPDFRDPKD